MGQKVNPIGMRLQVNRTWDSRWFAESKDYGNLLLEDLKMRGPGGKGNVTSNGLSKAMLAAAKTTADPNGQEKAQAQNQQSTGNQTAGADRSGGGNVAPQRVAPAVVTGKFTSEKPPVARPNRRTKAVEAKAKQAEAQRADYFSPGNIVKSYGGHDEVLRYDPPDKSGRWNVRVPPNATSGVMRPAVGTVFV
jgi:hypothetical protein